jgi:hypothetical protein
MNENKYTIGVFFDLKKAFYVCSHDILLMKLNKMGITGTALNWFKSYLSDRTQVVDINGNISILLGPPGCAQVFPLLEPGPPRFFWWYENSE